MNERVTRPIFLTAYIILAVFVFFAALAFSEDSSEPYTDNYIDVNSGWFLNGEMTDLPCTARDKIVLEKTLPAVKDDHVLVVQCFYMNAEVYIDDSLVLTASPNTFMGHTTNVGHNELKIPLSEKDSLKTVRIEMNVQNSVYTRRISDAFIYSQAGYVNYLITKNIFSLSLVTSFFITGLLEVFMAVFYIRKHTVLRAKYSLLSLLYTGFFSICSSIWVMCESRVVAAVFGHATAFAIINDVFFMLMPLTFLELLRTLTQRDSSGQAFLVYGLGIISFISVLLCMAGLADWNLTEYMGQAMVLIVFIHVVYVAVRSFKTESNVALRNAIIIGNTVFAVFSALGLILYMFGISENYLGIVIAGLMSYALVQVVLILQRIGISIEEEEQLVTVTQYAYNDDLTGLNNRRYFYSRLEEITKDGMPQDLNIISIDANRLKYFNDNYGHSAGDELLLGIAECITRAFSGYENAITCRMGGDEFAVCIIGEKEDIRKSIVEFRNYLVDYRGKVVSDLSVALGYVRAGDHPEGNIDYLYKLADDMMYEDKKEYYSLAGLDRRKS